MNNICYINTDYDNNSLELSDPVIKLRIMDSCKHRLDVKQRCTFVQLICLYITKCRQPLDESTQCNLYKPLLK